MKLSTYLHGTRRARLGAMSVATLAALFSVGLLVALVGGAQAASTGVPLGAADSFVVLAGAGVTDTGSTKLNGDLGTFPTTTITGLSSMTITGTNHAGDGVTQQAKTDLVTAFNNAAGQGPTSPISGDLGGRTLTAGVYNSASSVGLTGTLTLDAAGNANAVFVFQAGSTLTTASGSQVALTNGAQACNVFWQIGSSATLGTNSSFRGTIIAQQSITVTTGTTVEGRVLARDGAVTLDTNTITKPSCVTAPATTAATTTAPATTTAATTTTTTTTVKKPAKKPAKVKAATTTKTRARPAVRRVGLTG